MSHVTLVMSHDQHKEIYYYTSALFESCSNDMMNTFKICFKLLGQNNKKDTKYVLQINFLTDLFKVIKF